MIWYSCWTKKTLKAKIIIQIKKFKVHDKQKQNQEIDKYKVFYKYKKSKDWTKYPWMKPGLNLVLYVRYSSCNILFHEPYFSCRIDTNRNHECYLSSPPVFRGVNVTRFLVLYVCFVDRCLSFWTFSIDHCVVCSSLIYGL